MGAIYKIEFVPLKDLCGITHLTDRKIQINDSDSEPVQKETLLHELLHVSMEDCTGLSKTFKGDREDREETIVRHVSPRLFQILRDNPKVKHYILD